MRWLGCCLIGSMMVGPMDCGSSKPGGTAKTSTPPNAAASAVAGNPGSQSAAGQGDSDYVDPLVPAIDVSGNSISTTIAGGPIDFLATDEFDFSRDHRAEFHPHGKQVCASGCAASRHPTAELTEARFLKLLEQYATEPMTEQSPALEKLLYFGRQTSRWIGRRGTSPLDSGRAAFLRKQLSRTHALISFRIVDEHGMVRTYMPPTRVPLDRRHVFKMEVKNLPPLITSGTVKRVGLHHLWTRL